MLHNFYPVKSIIPKGGIYNVYSSLFTSLETRFSVMEEAQNNSGPILGYWLTFDKAGDNHLLFFFCQINSLVAQRLVPANPLL